MFLSPPIKRGHTLDLVITHTVDNIVKNCSVRKCLTSDHFVVDFDVCITKPTKQKIVSTCRNYKSINMSNFTSDLETELSKLEINSNNNIDIVYDGFEKTLLRVLDLHAPATIRTRTIRPLSPWYTDEIKQERRIRRRLERKWNKHDSEENRRAYKDQHNKVNKLIAEAKENYYNSKLAAADTKGVFQIVNNLLRKGEKVLPTCDSYEELSDSFANFSENKIVKIRTTLDKENMQTSSPITCDDNVDSPIMFNACMCEFKPVSPEDVTDLICKLPNKSCSLDIIPTWLLKQCLPSIVQPLTAIINMSLKSGVFPKALKEAIVSPIIKKASLDPNELKNYRPVSNIKCFSKVIEKCVMSQLYDHMSENQLLDPYQSAYKPKHGTETALLKVKNDILSSLDKHKAVFLILLDLSAAFDTIDYDILSHRLSQSLGITETTNKWIMSYLTERTSQVCISGQRSSKHTMDFGLPQGSVVGPGMFSYYTYPLGKIIQKHKLSYHIYADDTQLYIDFDPRKPGDTVSALHKIQACVKDIKLWMNTITSSN